VGPRKSNSDAGVGNLESESFMTPLSQCSAFITFMDIGDFYSVNSSAAAGGGGTVVVMVI